MKIELITAPAFHAHIIIILSDIKLFVNIAYPP